MPLVLGLGGRKFVEQWNVRGPAYPGAVGARQIAAKLDTLGRLPGMEVVKVC